MYFLGAFLVSIFTFLYGVGGFKFVSDLTCFAYPAYMSFKAIDSLAIEDDIQWLTYWIVFSVMSFVETTGGSILSFIPFYFGFKIMFMIWLYHPKYQGATLVYKQVCFYKMFVFIQLFIHSCDNNFKYDRSFLKQVLRPIVYPYLCKMSPLVEKKD